MKRWSARIRPKSPPVPHRGVIRLSPPAILFIGFVALIALGTIALKLPWSTTTPISWLDAAFTSTSAVTVTGLVVVDTGSTFTTFGQSVLMVLIQLGGMGLMTFAVLAVMMLGARLRLSHQVLIREAMDRTHVVDIIELVKAVALFAFTVEALGLALLALVWIPDLGVEQGFFHSLFYTVSAFNNAGFALSSDSLSEWAGNFDVNLVVTALFIIGGLGFSVLAELRHARSFRSLSLHTKLVLSTTVVVNLIAFMLFALLEWHNPKTLGALHDTGSRLLAAWFQAVTPRTAGFNTVDIGALTAPTALLTIALMFIGGGSNSTAGGIKLPTFAVLLLATRAFLRRRESPVAFHRSIAPTMVTKAIAVALVSLITIFVVLFVLTITEPGIGFLDLAFETVSAFGTVGLSRGITAELSTAGRWLIMALMLAGRIGPLTVGFLLATPRPAPIRRAEEEVQIG